MTAETQKIERTETGYAWFFERSIGHMRKIDTGQKYPGEDNNTDKGGISGHESSYGFAVKALEEAINKVRQLLP